MKGFTVWTRDARTNAILLLVVVSLLIGGGRSDVTTGSAEHSVVEEATSSSADSLVNDTNRSLTTEPLLSNDRTNDTASRNDTGSSNDAGSSSDNASRNDTGSRRNRHRHRDDEMLNSWLDDTNCTLESIMHHMTDGSGRLPDIRLPCQSQHLTISRQIPTPSRQIRREWTNSYSFSLSSLDRNATILNATLQFPISIASTGNWSSVRIAVDVQLIGYRAAIFRGSTSQRFRRKHLPTQLCFSVSAASVVQSLVRSGDGSLVSNIRVSQGGVIVHSDGGTEEHDRNPVMTVDALSQDPCPEGFWDSFPLSVP